MTTPETSIKAKLQSVAKRANSMANYLQPHGYAMGVADAYWIENELRQLADLVGCIEVYVESSRRTLHGIAKLEEGS